MKTFSRVLSGRAASIFVLAFLLLGASAVSLLTVGSKADPAEVEEPNSTVVEEPSPVLLEALESPPGLEESRERQQSEADPLSPNEAEELLESRRVFQNLDAAEAAQAAKKAFPNIVEDLAYQPLELAQGEHITEYPSSNVAQLDLPGDQRGVAESTLPLVTETPSGKESPVDLGLHESEGAIEPVNPLTPVQIPKQLAEGISLPESGLTLTPVDGGDDPLDGAPGVIEGATAFYANTQTDTDTLAKPLPAGFETQTLLRSPASPQKLYFRLTGRSNIQLTSGPGRSVLVEEEDRVLATVAFPSAVDASGTAVPVSMEIEGSELILAIDHQSANYQYPIAVDPTVTETNYYYKQGPWYSTTNMGSFSPNWPNIWVEGTSFTYGNYIAWNYTTQGISRIYEFDSSIWAASYPDGSGMDNVVGLIGKSGWEPEPHYLGTYVYPSAVTASCPAAGCASTGGTGNNTAVYEQIAINSGSHSYGQLGEGVTVRIAQDTGPSVSFDTTSKEIEGHPNPLYSNEWITSADEARIKATGTDPGVGIYTRGLTSTNYPGWSGKTTYSGAPGCVGVQCPGTFVMPANVGNLPDGVNTVEAKVGNTTGATTSKTAQIKIDNTAPEAEVVGLPANYTISRGSVQKLEFVLSDGEAPTASSGIAAAMSEVLIDGELVLWKPGTPGCTPGPCQVTMTYDLHSRKENAGVHTITVAGEDGTGNNVVTEVPFLIKPGPASQMGPGALDLASGGYSLSSTDVSPSSAGRGLSVTRSYDSQSLPVVGSPFGPNWQMSLGGWQGVERLTDGASVFTDARGRSMLFKPKEGGGYVTPPGYQGWSLTYDEGYSSQFGSVGSGNGQFKNPWGTAVDPKGNIWVSDFTNNRIEKFNEKGEYLTQCGSKGAGNGQLNSPASLAVDAKGNVWVADAANSRIQVFNEKCEYVSKFGLSGAGNGQLAAPMGVAVDAKGNVWVADTANNRIQKFNEKGEYVAKYGAFGSGNGQFNAPMGVAIDSKGNVWVADTSNNRIQKLNEKGEYVAKYGSPGSGSGQFNAPRGLAVDSKGNVWVTDAGNNRIEELNEKGEYVAQAGVSGSGNGQFAGPTGIAIDSKGSFWIADYNNNRVEKFISPDVHKYTLTDLQGDVTSFKQPGGESGLFLPSGTTGSNGTQGASFKFETVEGVTRPTQVLGPVPAGVTCTTLVRGCRALTFAYDVGTTATSDEPSGWGSYKGRLGSVELHAWNPETGSMVAVPVVDYSYDVHGRLRAVWDPRVSPALKTIYGYDAAGRVTAMTPPGQQTWVFKYGMQSGEPQGDWLLSVSRTKPSAPIGGGEVPQNTAVPTLTNGFPKVGTSYKVWNGSWTNSPSSYGYQWKRCSAVGTGCVPIAGAADQAYTPGSADAGHALVAEVIATNAGGSATAASVPSAAVGAPPLVYGSQFGKGGTGLGQFGTPNGIAVDSSNFIWVVDSANNRLQKFTSAGVFSAAYGSAGSGNNQFSNPTDIAINSSTGNIYVTDTGNNRIEQFTAAGAFVKTFGSLGSGAGQLNSPSDLAIDSSGNVLVADTGNHRIEKFSSSGTYLTAMNGSGYLAAPRGIAISGTSVYVSETSSYDLVFKLSASTGELIGCLCVGEGKPGSGKGEFNDPGSLATDSSGRIYVSDTKNNRFQVFSSTDTFLAAYGSLGSGAGQFTEPTGLTIDSSGNALVADHANRVQKWTPNTTQTTPPAPDPTTAVWTVIYHVPVSGGSAPYDMSASAVSKWAQGATPIEATAIFPPDQVPPRAPGNYKRATLYYMDNGGNAVNTVAPGGRITTAEYDSNENLVRSLSAGNRVAAMEAGTESATKAKTLDTQFTYSANGIDLLSVLSPRHKVKLASGKEVEARSRTQNVYDQGAPEGGPYHLITTEIEGAQISGEPEADVRKKTFSYSGQSNLGWSLRQPTSTTIDPGGLNLVSRAIFDPLTGNVTETRKPGNPEGGDAHSQRTVYYSAKTTTPAACGEHAEWADLPCQTSPAAQPGTAGLPDLPTTSTKYNIWQEPTTTTVVSGSESRTRTVSYDTAGRPTSLALSASSGTALPTVSIAYSSSQGVPTTASATGTKGFEATTSEYNSLGQLTSYTDASGVTSSYAYDIDGRPTEVDDGKGTQTSSYDSTTGDLTKLTDSDIGAITATYDAQGHIATESYPNGMTAAYTYDSTGAPTKVVDTKTTNCTEACTWYSDEVTPSIHGQWLKEISTRVTQAYGYDSAGRLTQTQETPVSVGCTTTLYGYDADANRTSTTTRAPKEGGGCAESGGTTVANSFDAGDRLTGAGVTYDPFGDITELPAAAAGGSILQSTYYVDGSLATQSQNGQTLAYRLDPFGRDVEVTASGSSSSVTVSHFSSGSDSPSWTIDKAGNSTRYVSGLDGTLAAIRQGSAEPQLQIANLHGDVIATAPLSETAKSLTWSAETTATGVPRGGKPAKYGWLGSAQRPTELASGVVNLGSHSYVPQLGRTLQPSVSRTGSSPYVPGSGDPVNEAALNGRYTPGVPAWLEQFEAHPPNLPPPPPPPPVEGAEEEELIYSEVDPVDHGDHGHLHVEYRSACGSVSCDVDFTFWGVITERGKKTSGMHLWVTLWNPEFDQDTGVTIADYGIISGERSTKHHVDAYISPGTFYIFNMYVRVGTFHENLRTAFTVVNGVISW